jgi:hypothetical protein
MHNVLYHHSANITIPPAPPKSAQLIVQSLHIHMIKFDEVLYQESLDSSTLSPVMALHMAFAARWWCSCSCASSPNLATLLHPHLSCCD